MQAGYLLQQHNGGRERENEEKIGFYLWRLSTRFVPKTPEKVAKFVSRSFSLIKSLGGSGKKLNLVTNPLSWQHCPLHVFYSQGLAPPP